MKNKKIRKVFESLCVPKQVVISDLTPLNLLQGDWTEGDPRGSGGGDGPRSPFHLQRVVYDLLTTRLLTC